MLKREIEDEIVPWCRANGVGVLAYSPMQADLLTGAFTSARVASLSPQDWRSQHPLFTEPQLSVNLRFVDRLRTIATKMGISVSQLALAWVLRLPEITSAIAGARNASQIQETMRAGRISLPVTVAAEIDDLLQLRERELSATV
jgi:aryl-alcohol dehydrogenase-like predicted oxidoreductase